MSKIKAFAAAVAVVLSMPAAIGNAAEQSKEELLRQEQFARQWHKDHDEEIENIGKTIDALGKMTDAIDQASAETYKQCMRVFPNAAVCKCVSENNPVSLNFIGFVMVNALEEGDQKNSDIPVEAAVNARIAHRKCIGVPRKDAQDNFEKALKTMHPRVAAWARLHRADLSNPERLKAVFDADKAAIKLGCAPGSDCYMGALNLEMGYGSLPIGR
jgi:hypothetical protein